MPSKHQLRQGGTLRICSVMDRVRALKDSLRGSRSRMHSFEVVWLNSCSRFKHFGMVPEH
jgi:hypothetical protein